jgi:hypothetical protein
MGDDWMGDDWMAFNLKVHQKLGALETTARVTRIHATEGATEKRNPGQGEIHCEAGRLEPGARRATLAAKQLVVCRAASAPSKRGRRAVEWTHLFKLKACHLSTTYIDLSGRRPQAFTGHYSDLMGCNPQSLGRANRKKSNNDDEKHAFDKQKEYTSLYNNATMFTTM